MHKINLILQYLKIIYLKYSKNDQYSNENENYYF